MPELLRGDSGNLRGRIAFASTFYRSSDQWGQKLCVETTVVGGDVVVCRWRLHLPHQLFAKAIFEQTLPNLSGRGQLRRNGNIGIQGSQGFIVKRLRQRMQAVEPVRPAADDNNLIEPRIQGVDQTREMFDVGVGGHQGLFSSMGARTRRRICSAWAAPRAGCEPTSSHTCRMSATGTPSRSTAPRKTDSRKTGTRT